MITMMTVIRSKCFLFMKVKAKFRRAQITVNKIETNVFVGWEDCTRAASSQLASA